MAALTVDTAKNIAIGVVVGFLILSIVSAWLIKNIVTKLIVAVLMAGLAFGAYTQRQSLSDCADKAKAAVENGTGGDVKCTFFGTEVDIPVDLPTS